MQSTAFELVNGLFQRSARIETFGTQVMPVEDWIKDPYMVGSIAHDLFPFWREVVIEFINSGKNEIILTGCLSGNTKIPLLSGEEVEIKELAESYGINKKFWVYSVNELGEIVPGRASGVRKTGEKKEVWKLVLDSGEEVFATPDHKFLLRNKSYKELKDLEPGDSLFPFYRSYKKEKGTERTPEGYERVFHPGKEEWEQTHFVVRKWKYGSLKCSNGDVGDVIHHKNFNKKDNTPENLCLGGIIRHLKYHSKLNNKKYRTEGYLAHFRECVSRGLRKRYSNPDSRVERAQNMRRLWESGAMGGEVRERIVKTRQEGFLVSELGKQTSRNNLNKYNQGEEYKEVRKSRSSRAAAIQWESEERVLKHKKMLKERNLAKGFQKKAQLGRSIKWFKKNNLNVDSIEDEIKVVGDFIGFCKEKRVRPTTLSSQLNLNGKGEVPCKYGFMNHKVVAVGFSHYEDVYDFEVEKYHNFMIGQGICVHNSLGSGKSYAGLVIKLRKLYELSCQDSITDYLGLARGSQALFVYLALSVRQANLTGYGKFRRLVDSIPYFKDNFPRNYNKDSELEFNDEVVVIPGSDISHYRGGDLFCLLFDEGNFRKGADRSKLDKATEIYIESTNRRKTRFMEGEEDKSCSIIVSSTDQLTSFTEERIREAEKDNSAMVVRSTTWQTKPRSYKGPKFWVFVGSEHIDPFIEDDLRSLYSYFIVNKIDRCSIENLPPSLRSSWIQVPIEFKKQFQTNIVRALADLAGIATGKSGRILTNDEAFLECFPKDGPLTHPFSKERLVISYMMPGRIEDYLLPDFKFNRKWEYYSHIDQSLSTDSTGLSIAHKEWDKEGEYIVVDLKLKIDPPGKPDQISVRKCREFIYYLKRNRGLDIKLLTYDQFACCSGDSIVLTREGHKELKQVKVGDEVFSEEGWKKVQKTLKYENAPVLEVVSNRGHRLVATPNHRIKVLKGWEWSGKENDRKPVWEYKRLDHLVKNDILLTSDLINIDVDYEEKRNELSELLGIYVGDGYLQVKKENGKEYWTMSICAGSFEEAETVQELVYRLIGRRYRIIKEISEFRVNITDSGFVKELMTNKGLKKLPSYEKEVPEYILKSKGRISSFLRGLFAAGGCVSGIKGNEGQVSLTSTSYKLVFQVKSLLSDYFGLSTSISTVDQSKYAGTKGNRLVYYLRVNGSREKFSREIGFSYKGKQSKLEGFEYVKGRKTFSKVKELNSLGSRDVYDLTVEGNPSYIVNSIMSHNSAEAIQEANNAGINAERQSVDKDSSQYDLLVDLILRRRIKGYYYQPFKDEIMFLEKDKLTRKVDHAKGFAKDISDSIAGSVFNAWVYGNVGVSFSSFVGGMK